MHVTGFKPDDDVMLILPAGARWGAVTDLQDGVTPPSGSNPFRFNDGPGVTSGSIGATWWDANNVAQATTIFYGP